MSYTSLNAAFKGATEGRQPIAVRYAELKEAHQDAATLKSYIANSGIPAFVAITIDPTEHAKPYIVTYVRADHPNWPPPDYRKRYVGP